MLEFDPAEDWFIGGSPCTFSQKCQISTPIDFYPAGGPGHILSRSVVEKLYGNEETYIADWYENHSKKLFVRYDLSPPAVLEIGACDLTLTYILWKYLGIMPTFIKGMYVQPPEFYSPREMIEHPISFHYCSANRIREIYKGQNENLICYLRQRNF